MEALLILLLFIPICKFLFRAVCAVLGFIGSIIGGLLQMIGGGMERREAERRADRIATERAARERRKIEDQARRNMERERMEKERHEWQREKMEWQREKLEWERQKEQDRRQELEWKRKQREQIEKERKEQANKTEKQRKRETEIKIACADLDYIDQSMTDLTPLVDMYRDEFENCVNDKAKWKAYKRLYQLEQRQNNLDKRRMKALYTIGGA